MAAAPTLVGLPAQFRRRKEEIIEHLRLPESEYHDLSPKGSIDEAIVPLVRDVLGLDGMVTTSSCSGRVSVFLEGDKGNKPAGTSGKGSGGHWLFVSHDALALDSPLAQHFGLASQQSSQPHSHSSLKLGTPRYVHFKFEPMILHILTASPQHAQVVLKTALQAGWRESGAINVEPKLGEAPTPLVAVRSTGLSIDCIVGVLDDSGEGQDQKICSLVTEDYLHTVVTIANARFAENTKRLKAFHAGLLQNADSSGRFLGPRATSWEDGTLRRDRKRAEGLLRQQQQQREARKAGDSNLTEVDGNLDETN